ncbi:MAG: PatB family C-S lyase [Bacteroidaceae bacterium]|nr:PatB family C-S lyase [Bacteroidaceae bacterium]
MKYDFDRIIDRSGTNALKYSVLKERYGREDLLPLWVADMDFETPDFITNALRKRLDHSLFGYTSVPQELWQTIARWIEDHHGWKVREEWITYIPGVMKGVGAAVNVFLKEDEKVIIQPPVYYPFRLVPLGNGRQVVFNPLKRLADGSYEMDFDNLAHVADDKCRMLLLSNPHNPAGICWSRETLQRLADFCYDYNIIVISDEIHADLALWGNRHIPFATVSDRAAQISITFGAPSKTFNTAGIVNSYAIVPDDTLRRRFYSWLDANELSEPHLLATIAIIAAFQNGEEWRRQLISYIEDNIRFVEDYCRQNIPAIKPLRPQATFLVWLDCTALNLSHKELIDLFVNKARLALNDGETFGPGGEGFMRLNVGAPRAVLKQALDRLSSSIGTR